MKKVKCEICVIEMSYSPGRKQPYPPILESEIRAIFDYTNKLNHDLKKCVNSTEEVAYYLNAIDGTTNPGFLHIEMCSGKYNRRRVVKNMRTNQTKGVLKEELDADEEHTFTTLYFPSPKTCYCAFESNYDGIGIAKFIHYLNHVANLYVKDLNSKSRFYKFEYKILVNKDFLTELDKMKKISMARIFIDSDQLVDTEFKANRSDVRKDMELIYKPSARGISIGRDFVKKLEKLKKEGKIKRVIANGSIGLSKVRIDTEEMKTKEEISVETNHLNEVKWSSIREIFKDKLNEYVSVDVESEEYSEDEEFENDGENEFDEELQLES